MKRSARLAIAAVVLSCAGLLQWNLSRRASPAGGGAGPDVPAAQAAEDGDGQPAVQMDIVFALDTTGSMSGLLAGAKAKIWQIARLAQQGKPRPELRVGLVAYRDKGDQYVTQVLPLTGDLDKVYATLSEFTAGGGGDGPEHVLMGLRDAVEKMPWSASQSSVRLVYLVGDAPPHYDYDDGITLNGVLAAAHEKGIRINAVRCGYDQTTLDAFTQIARPTDGEVASIEQSGGVVTAATPFDDELAKLNGALAATEVHYGTAAERDEAARVVATNVAAPAAAQADRASFYGAAGPGAPAKNDLTATPEKASSLSADELPEGLRSMSPDERARFLEDKRKEREVILAKVREASEKRDAFLRTAAAAAPAPAAMASASPVAEASAAPAAPAAAPSSFDAKVVESMRKAAAAKGVAY